MISFIAAVLVFGLIILIHELGHFLLAKKNGIAVIEFSIGMGPRLWSFTKGETKYSLKIFPFGGSCMMMGEDENESDPRAFNNKSVGARIAVVAAGPIFNFILAFIFALIIISRVGYDAPTIIEVTEGYPAQTQGLQPGDTILKMNKEKVRFYRDIVIFLQLHPGEDVNVTYQRATGETGQVLLTPKVSPETGNYMLGIVSSPYRTEVTSIGEAVKYSFYEIEYWISSAIKSLGLIARGKVKGDDIAGPVRIVSMIDETVDYNMQYGLEPVLLGLANMCVLLSANLGIMNLLPIPALDGGRLIFLILEAIRRKPIDKEKEGYVHMAGMLLLMGLMVLILFNDIRSLIFR